MPDGSPVSINRKGDGTAEYFFILFAGGAAIILGLVGWTALGMYLEGQGFWLGRMMISVLDELKIVAFLGGGVATILIGERVAEDVRNNGW